MLSQTPIEFVSVQIKKRRKPPAVRSAPSAQGSVDVADATAQSLTAVASVPAETGHKVSPGGSQDTEAELSLQHTAEHSYDVKDSPHSLKRRLNELGDRFTAARKKLKVERQKSARRKARVDSLTTVVKKLRSENLVSESCASMLENCFTGVPLQVMKRILSDRNESSCMKEMNSSCMKESSL